MAVDKRVLARSLKIMALIWVCPHLIVGSLLGFEEANDLLVSLISSIPFIAVSYLIVHRVVKKDSLTDLFGNISTFKTSFFVTFMSYTFLPVFGFLSLGLTFVSNFFTDGIGKEVTKSSGWEETTLMIIILGLFAPTFFINSLLIWVYKSLRDDCNADLNSEAKDE